MFEVKFYTNASWFTDERIIGRPRTIEDGLLYLASSLKYYLPNGSLVGLDGEVWCEYGHH